MYIFVTLGAQKKGEGGRLIAPIVRLDTPLTV